MDAMLLELDQDLKKISAKEIKRNLDNKYKFPTADAELSTDAVLILDGFIKSVNLTDDEIVVSEWAVYKYSSISKNMSKQIPKLLRVQQSTDFVLGFKNAFMGGTNRSRNLLAKNALSLWIEYKNKN